MPSKIDGIFPRARADWIRQLHHQSRRFQDGPVLVRPCLSEVDLQIALPFLRIHDVLLKGILCGWLARQSPLQPIPQSCVSICTAFAALCPTPVTAPASKAAKISEIGSISGTP